MKFRLGFITFFTVLTLCGQREAPVTLGEKQLWTILAPRAGFDAIDRAADINASLLHLAEENRRDLADVREVHLDTESILLVGRVYVFSVTDEDARLQAQPRKELFSARKAIALAAISSYRQQHAFSSILKSSSIAACVLILSVGLIWALILLYVRIARWLHVLLTWKSRKSKLASLFRVFQTPLTALLRIALGLLFLVVGLLVGFTSLSFILGLFPATSVLSGKVISTALDVVGKVVAEILAYLPNLLVLTLVAGIAWAAIKAAKLLATALETGTISLRGFHRDWAAPTYDLVRILLILFALVVAFPYLPGGDSPALKGASIFIGVLVSLGSGSAMGNVVAGIILIYMRPFQQGDRVQIADTTGDVVEKSLLVTRIHTIKNVEVIVPNSSVLGAHILNFSALAREKGLILNTVVTIGYDSPWISVHEALIHAALRTAHIKENPAPFVFQTSLNDSHVSYEINAYTDQAHLMAAIYSDLHKNIQDEFNARGIEIMSPMYLSVRDGNTVTIPEAQRPPGYKAPRFRVES